MPRYSKGHYEDVADILRLRYNYYHSYEPRIALGSTAQAFADLFAADNPPTCIHCGDDEGTTAVCISANGRTYDEHLFEGGFDRTAFLRACGIGP